MMSTMAKTLAERVAKYHSTPKGRMSHLMCNVRQRCAKFELECDIDSGYLLDLWEEQGGICTLSGVPFNLTNRNGKNYRDPYAPSVDRIDPTKGYVAGNVRLISTIANMCKSNWSDEVVIEFCRKVIACQS